MNCTKLVLTTSLIFLLFFKIALAAPKSTKRHSKKEVPTRITSDIIDIKRKSQLMEFIGHVVVRKGPDSMISERMLVFYEDDKNAEMKSFNDKSQQPQSTNKSSIKRIEAKKDVKIFSADMVAVGDSGYYDPKADIFVLEKNVTVNNGSSIGRGEKFVYNLKTQKGDFVGNQTKEALSGDKRVIFVISNDNLKSKKSSKEKDQKPKKNKDE